MQIDLDDKEIEYLLRVLRANYASEPEDFGLSEDIAARGIEDLLIGKLSQSLGKKSMNFYRDARRVRTLEEPIDKYLFCGCGYFSQLDSHRLHRRLQYGIENLSGIQQSRGDDADREMDEKGKEEINKVMEDIAKSFGIEK